MSVAEIARAKKAHKAHQALNASTVNDHKAEIRMNLIQDNEVTNKDVVSTEKAFGRDV